MLNNKRSMWQVVVLLMFLSSVFAYKDAEFMLAQTNAEGYSESLLHDALVKANKDAKHTNEVSLSEALESEEVRGLARQTAIDYASSIVDKKGMSRGLLDDPSLCENSWVYWLPWFTCPEPEPHKKQSLPLIKDTHKCYKSKRV